MINTIDIDIDIERQNHIKQTQTKFNELLSKYNDVYTELLYQLRVVKKPYNPNTIVQYNDTYYYITSEGFVKKYNDFSDVIVGKNGCPTNITTVTEDPTIYNHPYEGTDMVPGQSCGYAGENVFVNSLGNTSNISASYMDSYMDSETRQMNLRGGGKQYDYGLCKQIAINNNSMYFGLQDGYINPAKGQSSNKNMLCSISNDYEKSTGLGIAKTGWGTDNMPKNTGCTKIDGQFYSDANGIAVHTVNTAEKYTFYGGFKDSPVRAMKKYIGGYSFEEGQKIAKKGGYKYFGRQWGGKSGKESQFFVSNSLEETTQYGPVPLVDKAWQPHSYFLDNEGHYCGGGWSNAVYVLDRIDSGPVFYGCYWNNNNTMTDLLGKNTDVNSCNDLAFNKNYNYFGVSDGGKGTSSCFGSNDLATASQYGDMIPFGKTKDGTIAGGSWVNSIYKLDQKPPLYENIGKVGYITQNGDLKEYPTSMLTYRYDKKPNTNVLYANIGVVHESVSVDDCYTICNNMANSLGFVYNTANNSAIMQSNQIYTSEFVQDKSGYDTYYKIPMVNPNLTCNTKLNNITSKQWENYPKKEFMTPETNCNVNPVVQSLYIHLDKMSPVLNSYANELIEYTSNVSKKDQQVLKKIEFNSDQIKKDLTRYNTYITNTKALHNKFPNAYIIERDTLLLSTDNRNYLLFWVGIMIIIVFIIFKYLKK